ncbi:NADPH-dependent FMN reductase [Gemmatimonas sp.]|uniref:NADPH-dependent FMN reductase n=1 Tax=Gemmatimonas sp. TaxID=1962908 RepID=UPI00286D88E4|nr:NADPH-dependent FMN reductase [Gemmatimonas sp.]
MRILAISGSLRARSSNTELLRAAALVSPTEFAVELYAELGALPHFNPDLDQEGAVAPDSVARLRAQVGAADAVLISSPEYAHGVPGSLKNALDWLVSAPEMYHKPMGVLTASGASAHGPAALEEILRTMSTQVMPAASRVVALNGRRLDATQILEDTALAEVLRDVLEALRVAVTSPTALESTSP